MKFLSTLIISLLCLISKAQNIIVTDSLNTISNLSEVVIYSNKFPEKIKRIAQTVVVINDKNYRYFASGISAAGRNFIVTLKTQL